MYHLFRSGYLTIGSEVTNCLMRQIQSKMILFTRAAQNAHFLPLTQFQVEMNSFVLH